MAFYICGNGIYKYIFELKIYDMIIHTQQHSKSAINNTYQCRLG